MSEVPIPEDRNYSPSAEPVASAETTHLVDAAQPQFDPQESETPLVTGLQELPGFSNWEYQGAETHSPMQGRGERLPNLLHLSFFFGFVLLGLVCAGLIGGVLLHIPQFKAQVGQNMTLFNLFSMALMYLFTLFFCQFFFPVIWQRGFWQGLQWNASYALRVRNRLMLTAISLFGLAILSSKIFPGPEHTPIDEALRSPGAAWVLLIFGVTFAPLFEEIVFRGFLLPALCTSFDWVMEKRTGRLPMRLHYNGHPRWSIPAMIFGSMLTSIPFSLMHGQQTSYAVGTMVLLYVVSLAFCLIRLSIRSLAASVFVHMCYNGILFIVMMIGTGGFRNLDKL